MRLFLDGLFKNERQAYEDEKARAENLEFQLEDAHAELFEATQIIKTIVHWIDEDLNAVGHFCIIETAKDFLKKLEY